ncbi:hypothetical protein VNI00_016548 [Paramarasmius palmivorus]|uniref:Uncharacterized protein n=1 Tax=Paramarasmius palmivorus TaxID=297713 RepID=A0AAW0BCS0_9AGAR
MSRRLKVQRCVVGQRHLPSSLPPSGASKKVSSVNGVVAIERLVDVDELGHRYCPTTFDAFILGIPIDWLMKALEGVQKMAKNASLAS